MLVDTTLGAPETAAADARAAEEAGFDGAFTGEVGNDPFIPVAVAATATERLTLGTAVAVAFARSPMAVAYTAHDLQRLSGGRFVLGLGTQVRAHIERRFSMPWGRPAPQLREFVLALRAAWHSWSEGAPLAFEGEYYRHTVMPPAFVPEPHGFGPPAVLLAGVGEATTRVAGEVADGFLCHAFTTERWLRERTVPALRRGRARVGKTLEGFTVKAAVFVATGTGADIEARTAAIRTQLAFYASTPAYRPVLDLHGWGDLGTELTRLSKEGRWDEMPGLVGDDVVSAFAVTAPPAEVPALVARRCAGVVDRVSLVSAGDTTDLAAAIRTAC